MKKIRLSIKPFFFFSRIITLQVHMTSRFWKYYSFYSFDMDVAQSLLSRVQYHPFARRNKNTCTRLLNHSFLVVDS